MSFSLTYDTGNCGIKGVYSTNFVTLTDSSIVNYFELDVSLYNGSTKTVRLTQNDVSTAVVDVNKLMENEFNSCSTDPSLSLFQYELLGRSYHTDDSVLYSNSDASNWVLNGTKNNYNFYLCNSDNKSYLSNYGYNPKFLNDKNTHYLYWDGSLNTTISDKANNELKLYVLNGTFREDVSSGDDSLIQNLEIIRYDDTSTAYNYDISSSNNQITEVDIDPYNLNLNVPDLSIFSETGRYTIADADGNSETYTVYLDNVNDLNDKYFRLGWITKNGVLNHFNFSYNYQKSLKINKERFKYMSSDLVQYEKTFNTEADEIYNITTNWIKEDESRTLESLWVSPSVKASAFYSLASEYYKDFINEKCIWEENIILDVTSIDIKRRRNQKLINYSINFTIGSEYKIQKH